MRSRFKYFRLVSVVQQVQTCLRLLPGVEDMCWRGCLMDLVV